jgi:predicted ATP-grasp superfamily ATP-dependent carboligase
MPARSSQDRPRALLTNAEERSMLAACRSLKLAGYEVGAASFTSLAPTHWSRTCRRRMRVVDVRRDADGFVERLRRELTARSYDVLIPGTDSALLAISSRRERLQDLVAIGLPPHPLVERTLERESLAEAARAAGLTVVRSTRCADAEQALSASRELGLPVVLKSTAAALAHGGAVPGAPKGRIVRTEAELVSEARDFPGELLVQPVVPGEPISCGGVRAGGQLLGLAVSRYLRMWPPTGGSVTFAETIDPPRGLEAQIELLLATLGWEGIFELELIQSHAPGYEGFVPIDLNPRPYGSMALAAAGGVALAAIWCDWLLGRGTPSTGQPLPGQSLHGQPTRSQPTHSQPPAGQPLRARAGCRYRWGDAELRYSAWQLRHRHLRAALGPLRPRSGVTHAHFQRSDPLPALARGLYLGKRAGSRRWPGTSTFLANGPR